MRDDKSFVVKCLEKGVRPDGRKLTDFRDIKVVPNVVGRAEGSCSVKMGKTELMVGVKMAVEKPYPDTADQGNLMVNAELLPLSSPEFESGPPGIDAIELARVVDRGIREAHAIDQKKLCIEVGEKVWSVMIDICTINADGNLMDAAALGVVVALKTAVFPGYDIDKNEIDYKNKTDKKLPLQFEPVAVTVHKIKDYFIVDPLPEEEKEVETRLTVTTTPDGTICAMQKGGEATLTADEIMKMVELAKEKAAELRALA